ncbi:MAG: 2-oxo acid dehydrogenase subunit E2, partial [Lautropia sp.]|nr:2-oxo acid dehydrogenase subunit E2 [Lautropia sp.]
MGVHVIRMPDIGEGIAEVEVVAWHVQPGDEVGEDQLLAEVMTDKATVEVPSPVAGKVLTITGKVGELVAVGLEFVRIEVEGAGNEKAVTPRTVSTTEHAPEPLPAATAPAPDAAKRAASPRPSGSPSAASPRT